MHDSYIAFRERTGAWSRISLKAVLEAMPGAVGEPPSLVKDPARRAAELADRNTPARVPCVTLTSRSLGFAGAQDTGVMTDPLCALNGLINGFGGLPP